MYREVMTEVRVRNALRAWFGRGKIDRVLPVGPGVWMALLLDGGLAYATVEEDGSIKIEEREVSC